MNRRSVLIELSPARIRAVVLRGRVADGAMTVDCTGEGWEGAWRDGLKPLDGALATLVRDMELRGLPARVYAETPSMVCEVFSCAARGRAGLSAATLSLGDQAGFDLRDHPWAVEMIGADRGGPAPRTHWLVAAERNEHARAIERWVRDAGLEPRGISPLMAGGLAAAARAAIAHRGGMCASLYVGEGRSILTVGGGGRLAILRRLDLGVATLIGALTGPMSAGERDVTLTRDEAAALLFTHGIPRTRGVLDGSRGITGASVLPAIQPALQRCIVEVRQSLRFGLEDTDRADMLLCVTGPGAAVPNLGAVLAEQLQLAPGEVDASAAFDPSDPLDPRSDLLSAWRAGARLDVVSREAARSRSAMRTTRALAAGAAAALGLASLDAAFTILATRAHEREAASLNIRLADAAELEADAERIAELEARGARALREVQIRAAGDVSLGAWLRELAVLTPQLVRLTEMDIARDDGRLVATLIGYAVEPVVGEGDPVSVTQFAQILEQSPLVSGVSLGATQRASIDEREATRFNMRVTLESTPVTPELLSENGR